jgi:hypothetical protein
MVRQAFTRTRSSDVAFYAAVLPDGTMVEPERRDESLSSFRMGISFEASKTREKAPMDVRAANARIQLRSYRSRADRPDDLDRVVIQCLASL